MKQVKHCHFSNRYILSQKLGILISGGNGDWSTRGTSVEIWSPTVHCLLPNFELSRFGHSQEGLLACGSISRSTIGWTTCDKFENGNWIQAPYNITNRWMHVSWKTDNGIYLIGGGFGTETSDLLIESSGNVVPGFTLRERMQ